MNRHRLVVMGYAALCAVAMSAAFAEPARAEDAPADGAPKSELKVNLPVPPPGSDEAKYLEILEELGRGDHSNVPLLLEICAKHKEKDSFVRMSPAMLAAYQRNYLLDLKARRSTVALAAVASMRHFLRVEDAQKLRIAIEEWQIVPSRLGLQPKEMQFIKENTGNTEIKLPVVKTRVLVSPPVLASRHAVKPLVKSVDKIVAKPDVKPVVKRRRKSVQPDEARVDIRPAAPKRVRNLK